MNGLGSSGSIADSFRCLPVDRQRKVHLALCQDALTAWQAYVCHRASISYSDTVVGMRHQVDADLPSDALRSARAGVDLADVDVRYREPVTAMHDGDLVFPEAVTFAYYAVFNCFRTYACGEKCDPWLIVNQALSANEDPNSWPGRLSKAVEDSAGGGA